ncbi:GT2 family glycosyltransferase [Geodermatophilus normandii]|uniref:GT2 family glycosyltransferase n=1 Tax=Geodermatophilus normandii TaxID=1137989 RepID=A0A317QFR3_9ACTN|nr:glycosyltransferase [Geodermatophilus normandii]PWW21801.1 GT2 family glycosyltransferase [Geodermatophilus normandii]
MTALWCAALELAGEPALDAPLPFAGQPRARVLVRLHGEPLGYLTAPVPAGGPDVPALAAEAADRFATEIAAHLAAEGIVAPATEPGPGCPTRPVAGDELVSVVVCTRDRPEILAACLDRLAGLRYPHVEVVVVDNAPSDERTRALVEGRAAQDARFRYVCEPRPGLSRARNRGLTEARGRWLAYTDDDVAVDPGWVDGLLRGSRRADDIGCVTGLVATAGISGAAEEYFDARAAAWSTRTAPAVLTPDGDGSDPLHPYRPSLFGTGANLAFDRALLQRLSGFDEALGAGTRTRGGEDIDAFVRVLRAGSSIAYEPSALVWHHHRADLAGLRRQMYGYGSGLTAFATKCLLDPGTRRDVLRRVPAGLRRLGGLRADTSARLEVGRAEAAPVPAAR